MTSEKNSGESRQPEDILKVLVIEDNQGDIVIIREYLRTAGVPFVLSQAMTLRESIELTSRERFSVALLDLGLPDSSGIDTLKQFLAENMNLPVVVMTGLDDDEVALAALREGAQDYIVKNKIDPENIIRSIKYSIERKKLENLQKKRSHQLSILSDTTASLHLGDEISPIYSLICDSVTRLLENVITLSVEFIGKESIKISNSSQLDQWKKDITKLLGIDLNGSEILITKEQQEFIQVFADGRLYHVKGGLYELLNGKAEKERCIEIEALIGINYIYGACFLRNQSYLGGIIIFTKNPIEEDDWKIIENLCSQASLSIYRRLTKRNLVQSESRYQKLAEELEEKVLERTNELEKANEQLRVSESQLIELNATKDKFFSIVAHDLKNPFTSLLGATELLFENIEKMDREKIRRLSQVLNESAKSGYAILLNLLDWSRSQTGMIRINLQNLSLRQLFDNIISDLRLNCLDKEITITSDLKDDIFIVSDRNMLNTILRNLMSNAVKFTPRGGKIWLSAEINGDELTVKVKDTGIGIPEESIGKIFMIDSKYSRPGTDKELGTGLGLKLSREFVEKLGGRIWVRSEENKGSEFAFSIPLGINHRRN